MFLTYQQICQYFPQKFLQPHEIVTALNQLGFETNIVKDLTINQNLTVAYVRSAQKYGPKKRLSLCVLDTLDEQNIQVVCGAANVKSDTYVVYAPVGSTIYQNSLILQPKKIGDYMSLGMICAWTELGVDVTSLTSSEQAEIIVLPNVNANNWEQVNNDLQKALVNYVYEIELTYNRADCHSVWQIIIELGAYFGVKMSIPSLKNSLANLKDNCVTTNKAIKNWQLASVNVDDDKSSFSLVWNLKLLQYKASFHKPLANLFMLLNYYSGQICLALSSVDFKVLSLRETELVIGYTSPFVFDLTTYNNDYYTTIKGKQSYLLCVNLQKTKLSKTLNLLRYLSGCDLNKQKSAQMVALASQFGQLKWVKGSNSVLKPRQTFSYELDFFARQIGSDLVWEKGFVKMRQVGFKIVITADKWLISPPVERLDLTNKHQIITEFMRFYGYDSLETKSFMLQQDATTIQPDSFDWAEVMTLAGFSEVMTYHLTSKKNYVEYNFFALQKRTSVINPLTQTRTTLESSALFHLLEVAIYNNNRYDEPHNFFTFKKIAHDDGLHGHLAFLWQAPFVQNMIEHTAFKNNFLNCKGFVNHLMRFVTHFDEQKLVFLLPKDPVACMHPLLQAEIYYDDVLIGVMGLLDPRFGQKNKLFKTSCAELDLTLLKQTIAQKHIVRKRYVSTIKRDYTFLIPDHYRLFVEKLYKQAASIPLHQQSLATYLTLTVTDYYQTPTKATITLRAIVNYDAEQDKHSTIIDGLQLWEKTFQNNLE